MAASFGSTGREGWLPAGETNFFQDLSSQSSIWGEDGAGGGGVSAQSTGRQKGLGAGTSPQQGACRSAMPPAVMCATATLTEIALVLGFFFSPSRLVFLEQDLLCAVWKTGPRPRLQGKAEGGTGKQGFPCSGSSGGQERRGAQPSTEGRCGACIWSNRSWGAHTRFRFPLCSLWPNNCT